VNCGWYTEGITGGPTPKWTSTPACIEPGPATTAALCPVVTVCVLQLPKEFSALEETLMTASGRTWPRERGATPPLRPLPLGIVVVVRCVRLGIFFFFCTQLSKPCNFPCNSATATTWEHNPIDFQLGQFWSQLYPPALVGVTICGTFPE